VIRFKNPLLGEVLIEDQVKGNIVVANQELDDLVIARPDGVPTYNLTVVVDDWDMGITHVIRGDDHVNNTPRQINILKALGAQVPVYAHVPMILGEDGARLSKRHSAVGVMQYRDDGILPEALLNYLVRLGWSHGDQELFSMDELLRLFKIEDVSKAPSAFSAEKLLWVNQEKIKAMPLPELLKKSQWYFAVAGIEIDDYDNALAVLNLMRDRCNTLVELVAQSRFFFCDLEGYVDAAVAKWVNAETGAILGDLIVRLESITDWQSESIQSVLQTLVKERGLGFAKLAQPIRIAVTGDANSPSIDQTLMVLGKVQTLLRLRAAASHFAT
jgi:glutamyl-tRNA synthetase